MGLKSISTTKALILPGLVKAVQEGDVISITLVLADG
jgi:hypothetical protein